MKKIILFIAVLLLASCASNKATKIKTVSNDSTRVASVYLLDTLSNGHILMYEENNRPRCCIEYPECPKCKENLKKAITEVIDSLVRVNDESVVKLLSIEYK